MQCVPWSRLKIVLVWRRSSPIATAPRSMGARERRRGRPARPGLPVGGPALAATVRRGGVEGLLRDACQNGSGRAYQLSRAWCASPHISWTRSTTNTPYCDQARESRSTNPRVRWRGLHAGAAVAQELEVTLDVLHARCAGLRCASRQRGGVRLLGHGRRYRVRGRDVRHDGRGSRAPGDVALGARRDPGRMEATGVYWKPVRAVLSTLLKLPSGYGSPSLISSSS